MVASQDLADDIQRLVILETGYQAAVRTITPIDHPVYGQTVFRAVFDRDIGPSGTSAIVKRRREAGAWRSEISLSHNEIAALRFLSGQGVTVAPQVIASDDTAGIVVMEDLGSGPSLEDVLFDHDSRAATAALVAFGTALGEMHAATAGADGEYYRHRRILGPVHADAERLGVLERSIDSCWMILQSIVTERPELPPLPANVNKEIADINEILLEPGPWLVLSNGDPCPANTRLADGTIRFLDFEHASYHHALLDLTSLHLPFPACPCWSLMPQGVSIKAIAAYRNSFAKRYPPVLDDDIYYPQLAANCMIWAMQRLTRLPKLDAFDEPHPVGFSRRGQLLSTIEAAVNVARRAGSCPQLANWLADMSDTLETRWSKAPMIRPFFPAFATPRRELANVRGGS